MYKPEIIQAPGGGPSLETYHFQLEDGYIGLYWEGQQGWENVYHQDGSMAGVGSSRVFSKIRYLDWAEKENLKQIFSPLPHEKAYAVPKV